MKYTKDQQLAHVAEGLALGVLACDVEAVTASKFDLELALAHCWREWSRAGRFPSIGASYKTDNALWLAINRSHRRRGSKVAWEQEGPWLYPTLQMEALDLDDCLDLHSDSRASAADWTSLGRVLTSRLGPEKVIGPQSQGGPIHDSSL